MDTTSSSCPLEFENTLTISGGFIFLGAQVQGAVVVQIEKKNLIGEEIGGCHKVKKEIPPEFSLLRRFDRGLTNRKN